eukprot:10492272-Prorocentrum_lima.AAC.1
METGSEGAKGISTGPSMMIPQTSSDTEATAVPLRLQHTGTDAGIHASDADMGDSTVPTKR